MKKSSLVTQGGAGIVALVFISAISHADSVRYSDLSPLELTMADAAIAAKSAIVGNIIEAELEWEDTQAIWEIEIVNEANQVISVEVDGLTGQILSTESDDDKAPDSVDALSLAKAIDIITAIEGGALIEAELEQDGGDLIWEVETLGDDNHESAYRIHAQTGEILS